MLVSRHPPLPRGGAHRGFPRWAGEREGGHWTVGPEVSGRQMAAGCRSTLPPSASLSRGTRREREARRGARAGVRRPRPHSSDPRPSPQFNHGPRSSLAFASHQQCCAEPEVPHRAKPVIALGHSALRPRDGVPSGPSLAGAAWAGDRGARRPGVARLDATELRGTGRCGRARRSPFLRAAPAGLRGRDQVKWVVERLRSDPATRSATITTLQPLTDTTYVPCVSCSTSGARVTRSSSSSTPTHSTSAVR
jgi:hypothetical protein